MKYIILFLLGLLITLISEFIGKKNIQIFSVSILLFPMVYAVIIGLFTSSRLFGKALPLLQKILKTNDSIGFTSKLASYSLLILGVRLGFSIGPNIEKIFSVGWTFIAQEFGHFFVPVIAIPVAMMLGLKRESIGAATSICRESALGILSENYGVTSPEGRGVFAVYIVGTILGTIMFSIIGSLAIYSGLHPYALAMACGVGSASMMSAAASSLAAQAPPEMQETILTYAATSNLISSGFTGIYLLIFATLPFSNWYYDKLSLLFFNKNSAS